MTVPDKKAPGAITWMRVLLTISSFLTLVNGIIGFGPDAGTTYHWIDRRRIAGGRPRDRLDGHPAAPAGAVHFGAVADSYGVRRGRTGPAVCGLRQRGHPRRARPAGRGRVAVAQNQRPGVAEPWPVRMGHRGTGKAGRLLGFPAFRGGFGRCRPHVGGAAGGPGRRSRVRQLALLFSAGGGRRAQSEPSRRRADRYSAQRVRAGHRRREAGLFRLRASETNRDPGLLPRFRRTQHGRLSRPRQATRGQVRRGDLSGRHPRARILWRSAG